MTYLKLGQFLAMRYDVVPADISRELHNLFERITPAPFDEIRGIVEAELGGPLGRFFREFGSEPVAAASVAQVHEARLLDGRRVAVKVQRPGVREIFAADIRNFRRLAALVDASGTLGTLSLGELVDEFAAWTARELDFRIEASTAERLRENALPFEYAPLIYRELTTARVLAMEFIDGLSLAEISRLFEAGGEPLVLSVQPALDLRLALSRLSDACMHQLFITGFFHGDPHPGNIIIRGDNVPVFVDFGIFGELTTFERTVLRRWIEAIAVGNVAESLRYYMKQVYETAESDERAFRQAAKQVFSRWYQAATRGEAWPVEERHLGKYVGEVADLTRRYRLRIAMSTLLFWRALIALDSTAQRFPGYYDLLEAMQAFFRPSGGELAERLIDIGLDTDRALAVASLARDEPERLTRIFRALLERRREWGAELEESPLVQRANNRRTRGVALALVGLSLVVLGLGTPFDAVVRTAALALAIPLALWSLLELGRA
jgi:ubiquinone biosynthesis protein